MDAPQHILSPVLPLGWHLSWMSKLYYGALTMKLHHLDIDRYFVVLLLLHSKAIPMCQQEMCDTLYIDKTFMVKVVNYLQKSGHIAKTKSVEDRRRQLITLTEKGEQVVPEIQQAIQEMDQKILDEMDSKELKQFNTSLSRIAVGLRTMPECIGCTGSHISGHRALQAGKRHLAGTPGSSAQLQRPADPPCSCAIPRKTSTD